MKRIVAFLAVLSFLLALPAAVSSQTIPELFQKAKAQIKGESWQDALKTLDALDSESAKPGNESVREQLTAPLAFYRGVAFANVDKTDDARTNFEAFLKVQPNAALDPAMYSKKAIAAFEAAQRSTPAVEPGGSGSLFTRFQEFTLPANAGEPVNDQWAEGPVQWIMTPEEKRAWALLAPGAEQAAFIESFWAKRNPKPDSPDNVTRTSFERRVAFADAYLVQDEKKRGSMTDRGMVFVLLGPPTYAGRKPIRTGEDSSDSAGLSTVGSQDADNAVRSAQAAAAASGAKISSAQAAQITDAFSGPGTRALDSSNNYREVWHYRKELLPSGVGYLQVDFDFVTRKGYGVNILQRDYQAVTTLNAAKSLKTK